jgi:hypothetical protein
LLLNAAFVVEILDLKQKMRGAVAAGAAPVATNYITAFSFCFQ